MLSQAFRSLFSAVGRRGARRLLRDSGLFDVEWYRLAHPYVVRDGIDPLDHFLQHGRKHRLAPSRVFDTGRYLDQHTDARKSHLNPLVHYLKQGRAAGLEIHPAPPSDADLVLASGLFDAAWYLDRYPDASGVPPLLHYLLHGATDGRSPGPGFDAEWYVRRYPDIAGLDPLLHFITHGRNEGRMPAQPARPLEIARQTLTGIEDLEPELSSTAYFEDAGRLDVIDGRSDSRVARCLAGIIDQLAILPRYVVFLPWLARDEADFMTCHAIRAMTEAYGAPSVLLVPTDENRQDAAHLLPTGLPLVSLREMEPSLTRPERTELVDLLVRGLQPEAVLNAGSSACWDAIKRGGRKLRHFSRLFALLPPSDDPNHDANLRHCLPFLTGVYCQSPALIRDLVRRLGIPATLEPRLIFLPQPAPPIARPAARQRDGCLRVLWANRLNSGNKVERLIRIADATPDIEFHIWGRGSHALEGLLTDLATRCGHVHFHGAFERFENLPLADYDAFLHTSDADGIPNVLIEAASAGLPIVTAEANDLADRQTAWPTGDPDDPAHYSKALRDIGRYPTATARRLAAMRRRLRENHDWKLYREILATQPHMTGGLLNGPGIDHGGAQRPSRRTAGKAVAGKPEAGRRTGGEGRVPG